LEKDIEQRFDKIENMLRHLHEHLENVDVKTWVIREGLQSVASSVGNMIEDLQKGEEFDGRGESLGEEVQDFLSNLAEGTEENYSPIDEIDKEKYDKEEEYRSRMQRRQLENELEKRYPEELRLIRQKRKDDTKH
jgi:flagellar biosynthesis chaperone FliJ